ncbi:hypothetical protein KL906_002725 [Ogataea polymorpha]|uniref:RNA helicase n=2 Tax=Ogataea polymorpha TaxID=460523 RepID=A0A9P8PUP9_9ASCO|nr:hypothetical protein KL937_003152 [Ogataea polymorpha]KAG7892455.1 hypothetical protein KL908_003407 [Ogataea polymorpha]KAG7909231.1 hypothetical protein KL906_002725 [Ogataea polymorpha]KAG7916037.1 hypothetical protein KL927_003502 [Ogataea polymorpha]KAG7934999.1 hypothetical protein KL904_003331 [Ogataea polymorpha]
MFPDAVSSPGVTGQPLTSAEEKRRARLAKLAAWKKKKEAEAEKKPVKFTAKAKTTPRKPTRLVRKNLLDGPAEHTQQTSEDGPLDLDTLLENMENSQHKEGSAALFESDDEVPSETDADAENLDPAKLLQAINEKNKKSVPEHPPSEHPYTRRLYKESVFISSLSPDEVNSLRLRDAITVRGKSVARPIITWDHLGLPLSLRSALDSLGFEAPTPIQCEALPNVMSGHDLIGIAKTGSGKTLAFLLPLFRQLLANPAAPSVRALVMTPTRELAMQIFHESSVFLQALKLRGCCCYGGQSISQQIAEIKKGCDLVVGTPGRIIDLLCANNGRVLRLSHVTYLVLDEADRMFDMGFEPQVMKILKVTRPDRQTVLFSATFPPRMEALARRCLTDPVEVLVGAKNLVNDKITQQFEVLDEEQKFGRLVQVLARFQSTDSGKILIFVDKQDSCDSLANQLIIRGYPALSLHGGKEQIDRDGIISDFKSNVIDILVATSVASRGLDVKDLNLVVNYDSPNHMEDYVHRVGRTGRAGRSGTAITFVTRHQERSASDIVRLLELSGTQPPAELVQIASRFREKLKRGEAKYGSGFGGRGLEKLAEIREQKKKLDRTLYEGENGSETNDDDDDDETAEVPSNKLKNFQVVFGSIKRGPDSAIHHAKMNINDLPQSTRWHMSNKDNINKVVEATGTSITTKGRYYGPGKEPGAKEDPKLYLLIEGDNEMSVRQAVEMFKRSLVEGLKDSLDERKRKFTIV